MKFLRAHSPSSDVYFYVNLERISTFELPAENLVRLFFSEITESQEAQVIEIDIAHADFLREVGVKT